MQVPERGLCVWATQVCVLHASVVGSCTGTVGCGVRVRLRVLYAHIRVLQRAVMFMIASLAYIVLLRLYLLKLERCSED